MNTNSPHRKITVPNAEHLSHMTDVKGEFRNDIIDKDTYFQSRLDTDGNDVYYIIYKWWDKLFKGEVNFADVVNGAGTVLIARN